MIRWSFFKTALLIAAWLILADVPAGAAGRSSTSAPCTRPVFVTSRPDGMWSNGGYVLHNNMWNVKRYKVSQTMSACAYNDWSVTATADNRSRDGAVKTYPNVHKDYHNWNTGEEPRVDSFRAITSSFAASSPPVGIYDVAYDIWLNGVPGNREIMIWTDNRRQVPSGSLVARSIAISGQAWDVYATRDNRYIAFVLPGGKALARATLDLKAMIDWLIDRGRVNRDATLGQICFGVELVSTDGKPASFAFTDFSITDQPQQSKKPASRH